MTMVRIIVFVVKQYFSQISYNDRDFEDNLNRKTNEKQIFWSKKKTKQDLNKDFYYILV